MWRCAEVAVSPYRGATARNVFPLARAFDISDACGCVQIEQALGITATPNGAWRPR